MNRSRIAQSGGVGWIASLMQQLLEEVRVTPVGVAARTRIAAIHDRSVTRVERRSARDVVDALDAMPVPFCGQKRARAGMTVDPGHRVSRIDRLLDNIETSQFGQQRQRQRRRAEARRPGDAATSEHVSRQGATRSTDAAPHDGPANHRG